MTSDPEWNDLADAWRNEPEVAEPLDLPRMRSRLKRRALIARFKAVADVVLCLVVAGVAISAIAKGTATGVIMGLGGLAFVLFGLTIALWVARAPWEARAETVNAALNSEIVQTRSAIRRARSGYYTSAAATAFIILTAIMLHPSLGGAGDDDMMLAVGLSLATIIGTLIWSVWSDRRLNRKLARLEKMLAELAADDD